MEMIAGGAEDGPLLQLAEKAFSMLSFYSLSLIKGLDFSLIKKLQAKFTGDRAALTFFSTCLKLWVKDVSNLQTLTDRQKNLTKGLVQMVATTLQSSSSDSFPQSQVICDFMMKLYAL